MRSVAYEFNLLLQYHWIVRMEIDLMNVFTGFRNKIDRKIVFLWWYPIKNKPIRYVSPHKSVLYQLLFQYKQNLLT